MSPELHADAVRTLSGWRPPDPEQAALRAAYLAALQDGPVAVTRAGRPDHLTASAVVLDPDARQVCLVLHRKVRRWLQPGGHCEVGDRTLAEAALREAAEETGLAGLQLTAGSVAGPAGGPVAGPLRLDRHGAPCAAEARDHLDVQYLAVVPAGTAVCVSEESLDVAWWPVDALPHGDHGVDPAVRRLVEAAVAAVRNGHATPAGGDGQASAPAGGDGQASAPGRGSRPAPAARPSR